MINIDMSKIDNRQIYYVYEWYDVDSGDIFYVGKGRGNRAKIKYGRNRNFNEYVNNHKCSYRIIKDKLDEYNACFLEDKRIEELDKIGMAQCNLFKRTTTRGVSYGEDNGFYGKTHSKEIIEKLRQINSDGRNKGKNNSQYGISPQERMTKEKYIQWKKNLSKSLSKENNPQFGISIKERMKDKEGYERFCKSCSRGTYSENPNAKEVWMISSSFNKHFNCLKECADWLVLNNYTKNIRAYSYISRAMKSNQKYLGFNFCNSLEV